MIESFSHKGLKRLYEQDDQRGVQPEYADKIKRILSRLEQAAQPRDMDLPGYKLHRLRGDRAGQWAVRNSGNWRIVFRFKGGNARDVDLCDYH